MTPVPLARSKEFSEPFETQNSRPREEKSTVGKDQSLDSVQIPDCETLAVLGYLAG